MKERARSSSGWTMLALLSSFMLINFWDRTAFGFASIPIMRDLRLSHAEFGVLAGVFFWLFPPSAFIVGWLADRWSPRWIVGCMAVVWGAAQGVMAVAVSVPVVLLSRLMLGAAEGPALPLALQQGYANFPRDARAGVTAIVGLGMPVSLASGALLITWSIHAFGWRTAFALLSCVSIAWSIGWMFSQRSKAANARAAAARPPQPAVRRFTLTAFGVIVAAFCVYWVLALAVNWFPAVLQSAHGLTQLQGGAFLVFAWGLQAVLFPVAGRVFGSMSRRGRTTEAAFALPALFAVVISGLALALAGEIPINAVSLPLLAIALGSVAIAITCLPPIIAEITLSQERGAAFGVFAAISSTAGAFAPAVFGKFVDIGGGGGNGYRLALLVSGIVVIVGAVIARFCMQPTRDRVIEPMTGSASH